MTIEPGQTLSHYRLIERIGEGGMGVVWKAQDTILGRTVAIKVLPADVAGEETRRRMFLDEARLASSVSDAHIAQVHELGREGSLDFIVMEFVEGKPLNRILHGRPLPPDKVANLGHQVAQALARAHRKSLLHRDLKPSNILVTPDGEIKVVDFGLAMLFEHRDSVLDSTAGMDTETLTQDDAARRRPDRRGGGLIGTLPYMSPEQARAEKLDARSDIFSLGVVLYEMTTGQRPFSGTTNVALLKEIVRAQPRPPHEVAPKVPLDLERIIQKALAPAKADRYQTMDDLAVDLKRLGRDLESGSSPSFDELGKALRPPGRQWLWIGSGGVGLALAAAGFWAWTSHREPAIDPRTVLVVPMEVLGKAEENEYLGRAFAEAIAVNLSQSKGISVLPVAQQASSGTMDRDSLLNSARAAGAGRVLTGTLVRDESTIHLTLSMIDSERNRLVWGSQQDTDNASLASSALSITRELASELGAGAVQLYDGITNTQPSSALAASPDYMDAQAAFHREDSALLDSATQRMAGNFPDDALVHYWRLVVLMDRVWDNPLSEPTMKAWEEEAAILMRLDPRNPWADISRAVFALRSGHFRDSIARYSQLLTRDDLTADLRSALLGARAQAHASLEEYDAAVGDLQSAARMAPLNPSQYQSAARVLYHAGRYEEALVEIRRSIALRPQVPSFHAVLGYILYALGRWNESVDSSRSACEAAPTQESCAILALALHRNGAMGEARMIAENAATMPPTSGGLLNLSGYFVLAHERMRALDLFRKSLALEGNSTPGDLASILKAQPDFADFQGDPEFKQILEDARKRLPAQ